MAFTIHSPKGQGGEKNPPEEDPSNPENQNADGTVSLRDNDSDFDSDESDDGDYPFFDNYYTPKTRTETLDLPVPLRNSKRFAFVYQRLPKEIALKTVAASEEVQTKLAHTLEFIPNMRSYLPVITSALDLGEPTRQQVKHYSANLPVTPAAKKNPVPVEAASATKHIDYNFDFISAYVDKKIKVQQLPTLAHSDMLRRAEVIDSCKFRASRDFNTYVLTYPKDALPLTEDDKRFYAIEFACDHADLIMKENPELFTLSTSTPAIDCTSPVTES